VKITVGIGATRANTVEAAACSILGQAWRDWELFVVGQGTDPALAAVGKRIEGYDARMRYLHLPEMGLSRARNEVIRCAEGEVIAFIDDDCEADPQWLAVIASFLQADPSLGLVGGALVPPPAIPGKLSACPTSLPVESLYDPALQPHSPPPGWDWVGASVAIRADVVAQVGLFDELLGPGATFQSGEDTDYKLRLEALRVRMLATPRAAVRHTYGRRVGLKAVGRLSSSYARGAGAVAGKLTAAGDPRGAAWAAAARRKFWSDLLTPKRSVAAIHRLPHFLIAYREVVAGYTVDSRTGCLRPKSFTDESSNARSAVRRGGAQCDRCGN
jgi:glycosyltransferase involved in cell wall biosynthesis